MCANFTHAGDSGSEPREIAAPEFQVRWEGRWGVFFENLAEFLRPRHKFAGPPGVFWNNVLIPGHTPAQGLISSLAIHATVIGILILTRDFPMPGVKVESPLRHAIITSYSVSDFLPALQAAEPAAVAPKPQAAKTVHPVDEKPDPVLGHQEILSVAPEPERTRQTVVTPVPVRLPRLAPLPNLISVTRKPVLEAPPPVLELARTPQNFHANARPSDVEVPAPDVPANLPPMNLPQNANTPTAPDSTRIGALDISRPPVLARAPKLAVAEQTTVPPATQVPAAKPEAAPEAPPTSLLALSTKPAEISGPIAVPLGTQRDEFAASPAGKADASGAPGQPLAKATEPPSNETALAKASPPVMPAAPSASVGVVVASKPSFRDIMAAARADVTRPGAGSRSVPQPSLHPEPGSVDATVFGESAYRSMTVNMPNLTSAAGTWEIRFAEFHPQPDTGELQAPAPLNKADPAYPADLIHDQVEGVVVLYAVIRADGSVGEIRLLQGVDRRLDASAVAALAKWHFAPAVKNGQAIALQAVVRVPFRARRLAR